MKMRSSLYNTYNPEKRDEEGNNVNNSHFEDEIIRENEAILSALGNTVSRMKASAGVLRNEAGDHNRLLDTLSGAFSRASGGVGRSVQRIEGVMNRYGWRHTLLIGLMVFMTIYGVYHILRR
ncbi:putative Qc-SNARE protein [Trypanosoma theileri]|uniref:Putative Qc-SNARE protein n=1 Tax=Trypanosoma theileri TaxID=67003 RepID=A0A1X0P4K2_9TRYP|nr:putative Qc-SNARE protein [Trypanosoma theileri]ORC91867.1 putative Qc-SNARE protein [Trypanosoma theileri]